jgi:hypothetical protein
LTDYATDVLLHAGPSSLAVPLKFNGLALYFFLKHHVIPGLENFPEDLLTTFSISLQ